MVGCCWVVWLYTASVWQAMVGKVLQRNSDTAVVLANSNSTVAKILALSSPQAPVASLNKAVSSRLEHCVHCLSGPCTAAGCWCVPGL